VLKDRPEGSDRLSGQQQTPVPIVQNEDERAAFDEVFLPHMAEAYRLAQWLTGNSYDAEDVVQEAWMGVLRGLPTFEGRSSLRGWIFTIVVNRAKTRGVREARSVPFSALAHDEVQRDDPSVGPDRFAGPGEEWPRHWRDGPVPWTDRPEEKLLSRELRARIDAAIDALPAAQRSVIVLRDIAGQPTQDVCNALDLSETNVRVLLHRARAKLRRALDPYLTGDRFA